MQLYESGNPTFSPATFAGEYKHPFVANGDSLYVWANNNTVYKYTRAGNAWVQLSTAEPDFNFAWGAPDRAEGFVDGNDLWFIDQSTMFRYDLTTLLWENNWYGYGGGTQGWALPWGVPLALTVNTVTPGLTYSVEIDGWTASTYLAGGGDDAAAILAGLKASMDANPDITIPSHLSVNRTDTLIIQWVAPSIVKSSQLSVEETFDENDAVQGGVFTGGLFYALSRFGGLLTFDPSTATFDLLDNHPSPVTNMRLAKAGNYLYALSSNGDTYRFDLTAKTWASRATLPSVALVYPAIAGFGDDLLVLGGGTGTSSGLRTGQTLYYYSASNNAWYTLPGFSQSAGYARAAEGATGTWFWATPTGALAVLEDDGTALSSPFSVGISIAFDAERSLTVEVDVDGNPSAVLAVALDTGARPERTLAVRVDVNATTLDPAAQEAALAASAALGSLIGASVDDG